VLIDPPILEERADPDASQQQLDRATRAARVFAQCSRARIHARDEDELLRELCRIVVGPGGYLQSYVGYARDDADRTVAPVAEAGFEPGYLDRKRLTWSGVEPSLCGRAIRTGKPHLARNLLADPACAHLYARALERGFQSMISLPLRVEGRVVGGFSIYAREADAFDPEEVSLLTALTDDIAYGIGALRREAAREAAEAALRRVERARCVLGETGRVLIHASAEEEMLSRVCQIFVEAGGYRQAWIGAPAPGSALPLRASAHAGYGSADGPMATHARAGGGGQGGLARDAFETGTTQVARNVLTDPALARKRARALELGYGSSIAFPLRGEGAIVGVLVLHAAEDDAFDASELALLGDVAEEIGFGIGSLRLRASHAQAEARLLASERRLRETFEQAAVGITRVDLEGRIVDVNEKFCQLLGYGKDELVGRSMQELTHPDDYSAGSRLREHVARGAGSSVAGKKRYLRKDGGTVWARRTMSAGCDDAGRRRHIISIVEDMSESRELERRFEQIFEQAAVGIALLDLEGRYVHANEAAAAMLGFSTAELPGRSLLDSLHPADVQTALTEIATLLDGGAESVASVSSYMRSDGGVIRARRVLSITRDANAKPLHFVAIVEDITASTAAAEIYRATFDHAPVGIMHNAVDTEAVLKVNPKLCAMLGYSEEELLGLKVEDIIHREDLHADRPKYRQQMLDGKLDTYSSERRLACKDGRPLWVYRTISLVRDASGAPSYFIRMMEDISERKRAEEAISVERALLRTVVDTIPERIYAKDREGRFRFQNVANVKAHGVAAAGELIGKTVFDVFPPEVAARMEAEDRAIMESGAPIMDRERMVSGPGENPRWIASTKVPLPDGNGNIIGIVGVSRDITDRKRIEQELTNLAHFDVLTGLPNRASFGERLTEALAYARTNGWTTGVMFVDLDRFKDVNDTLGHSEGDKLLKQAADRLVHAVRRGDTVARLGGDEFAVVLTNLGAGGDAEIVARKIVASLSEPFQLAGTEACVSASIGISLCPSDALDEDTLVRSADAAMYAAKKAGRNGYRFHAAAVPTISESGKL